jgi:hypothetical protein
MQAKIVDLKLSDILQAEVQFDLHPREQCQIVGPFVVNDYDWHFLLTFFIISVGFYRSLTLTDHAQPII